MYPDTPLPGDEPAGKNPPDGAIIDYYISTNTTSEITLDISDSTGKVIRHFSSKDTMYKIPDVNIPLYWVRPQQILSADTGSHRFLWDMRYEPLNVPAEYPISAIVGETTPVPTAPWVMPGTYTVKLSVNGRSFTQSLVIKMDPRVKTSVEGLRNQYNLSSICYVDRSNTTVALKQLTSIQAQLKELIAKTTGSLCDTLKSISARCDKLKMGSIDQKLKTLFDGIQLADVMPTSQDAESVKLTHFAYTLMWIKWLDIKKSIVPLNAQLAHSNIRPIHF
jgi:hypothetical protein